MYDKKKYSVFNVLREDHERIKHLADIKGVQHVQAFQLILNSYFFHNPDLAEQVEQRVIKNMELNSE